MKTENLHRLDEIFRAVFALPSGSDVAPLSQANTPSWDSLAHVALVSAIESEFGLSFDIVAQLEMTSYETIADILDQNGL